ncbi:LexA family transcriptional regulator [Candidatus Symbiopectobacterium sp. NZEC135]|uniref:LexA family transcriptional regulator n=1 Tax=Candidatus Symbiopectobacterium sp. NZEC135 TaxID=2820471 RepID=UPI002A087528|nr:helix-turn-helix transcriptional regulator [Candidatus Symbiopectobacterium sp. NZEC135]
MKEAFSNRLHTACQAAGVAGRGLSGRIKRELKKQGIDVSEAAIWKWLNKAASPDHAKIQALSKWLNVRPEWLEYGIESKARTSKEVESSIPPESEWGTVDAWDSRTPLPEDEVYVPFLKDIEFACGDGRLMNEDHNGYKLRFSKATLRRVGANTDGSGVICFPASGRSMEPVIPDGSTVAVDTTNKRIIDGELYAINQNDLKRIKQLYRRPGGKILIRSFNREEFDDEESDEANIEIIGFVFWYAVLRSRR